MSEYIYEYIILSHQHQLVLFEYNNTTNIKATESTIDWLTLVEQTKMFCRQ